jgi:hypothetical protein
VELPCCTPVLYKAPLFDSIHDFVTFDSVRIPDFLAVNPKSPAQSVNDLIARRNPNEQGEHK